MDHQDLVNYGLIPEFVGRFPVIVPLQGLTEEELVHVLMKPRNALCKQYKALFAMSNADMRVSNAALRAIAREAKKRGTGARGLKCIMERLLLETMYQVPDMAGAEQPLGVVLDEAAVMGREGQAGARLVTGKEKLQQAVS